METWKGTIWLIEGDISACFDEIDQRTLEKILRERISDERFIRLINKILKAGYFDMQHIYHGTKTGNAQGSCCNPILCNIYLDKLDRFMENIIKMDTTGDYRRQNPDYAKARYLYKKAVSNGSDLKTVKHLKCEMESLPSGDRFDPNFRRVKYVRYDDFLIGLIAPKVHVVDLKQKIKEFLKNELCLRLSEEKSKITHAADSDVTFLGYINRKGSVKYSKFHYNPFDSTIRTQQRGCANFYEGARIQYIVHFSITKTLARKFDISIKKVFARYGRTLLVNYTNAKGKACSVSLALYKSFARQKDLFTKIKLAVKSFFFLPMYNLMDPLPVSATSAVIRIFMSACITGKRRRSSTNPIHRLSLSCWISIGVRYPFAHTALPMSKLTGFSLIN